MIHNMNTRRTSLSIMGGGKSIPWDVICVKVHPSVRVIKDAAIIELTIVKKEEEERDGVIVLGHQGHGKT